jgi:hypothetical protein
MVYTFACPVPCHRVIEVHANSDDDAIDKIIVAGAVSCRNMANRKHCEEGRRHMPSLSMEQLRDIVRVSMEAESVDRMTVAMSEKRTNASAGFPYTANIVPPGIARHV